MITPKYTRFVLSSKQNVSGYISTPSLPHPQLSTIHNQNCIKFLKLTPSSTQNARFIINSQPNLPNQVINSQPNLSNQFISLEPNLPNQVINSQPNLSNQFISLEPNLPNQVINSQPNLSNQVISLEPNLPNQVISSQPNLPNQVISSQPNLPNQVISSQPNLPNQVISSQPNLPNQVISSQPNLPNQVVLNGKSTPKNQSATNKYNETTHRNKRKVNSKIQNEELSSKVLKRSKNWSEDETLTFISVWSEYYSRLTSGGTRNTPIYNCMAEQLKNVLSNRSLTGNDVKSKISNLIMEYRKRKKEQGRTGAAPCNWRYYDAIDKLIGERPYNDDGLLSDSMTIEEELLNEIENVNIPDLNMTQVAQQVHESAPLTKDLDETITPIGNDPNNPSSSSDVGEGLKAGTPVRSGSTIKKTMHLKKKKKASEMKIDLIQQLLGKIENANEAAAESEMKILNLLEKQTLLQQESVNNEREFLNVFKTIMNKNN